MSLAEILAVFEQAIAARCNVEIRHAGAADFVVFFPEAIWPAGGGASGTMPNSGTWPRTCNFREVVEARVLPVSSDSTTTNVPVPTGFLMKRQAS